MAMLFVEDSEAAKRTIEYAHETLYKPKRLSDFPTVQPISRIKDGVNFVRKNRALFLQLADGCASVLRRAPSGAPENDWLLERLLNTTEKPDAIKKGVYSAGGACFSWPEKRRGLPLFSRRRRGA